jgi:diketogulonate reductase-like aldo/keto reductase
MSGREATSAVKWALQAGYRGIDSAQMYRNERDCGQAILSFLNDKATNTAGLTREDIFFTSKLASNTNYETARHSIKQSVLASGLGYIDLFLLHSPYGGKSARLSSWRAVEDAIQDGEIKIGGVSNFGVKHLDELVASKPRIMPAVNQIEVHREFSLQHKMPSHGTTGLTILSIQYSDKHRRSLQEVQHSG